MESLVYGPVLKYHICKLLHTTQQLIYLSPK